MPLDLHTRLAYLTTIRRLLNLHTRRLTSSHQHKYSYILVAYRFNQIISVFIVVCVYICMYVYMYICSNGKFTSEYFNKKIAKNSDFHQPATNDLLSRHTNAQSLLPMSGCIMKVNVCTYVCVRFINWAIRKRS